MPLAMALSSSHLNNAAERRVKRPPTRSVPIMRVFLEDVGTQSNHAESVELDELPPCSWGSVRLAHSLQNRGIEHKEEIAKQPFPSHD